MTDLRTRIAVTISDYIYQHGHENFSYGDLADAVIRELELSYQYENGRVMYDTKPAACKANGNWQQRIVSPHEPYVEE